MRFDEIRAQLLRDMGHASTSPSAEVIAGTGNWAWWVGEFSAALPSGATRLSLPRNYTGLVSIRNADGVKVHAASAEDLQRFQATSKMRCAEGPSSVRTFSALAGVTLTLNSDVVTSLGELPVNIAGRTLYVPTLGYDARIVEYIDANNLRLAEPYPGENAVQVPAEIDPAGTRVLTLDLPTGRAETLTLRYFFRPDPMVNDDDIPTIPEEFHYYLVVKPRDQLLQVQREQQGLTGQARFESDLILSDMRRASADMLRNIQPRLRARL
jgi:hypothetical protein